MAGEEVLGDCTLNEDKDDVIGENLLEDCRLVDTTLTCRALTCTGGADVAREELLEYCRFDVDILVCVDRDGVAGEEVPEEPTGLELAVELETGLLDEMERVGEEEPLEGNETLDEMIDEAEGLDEDEPPKLPVEKEELDKEIVALDVLGVDGEMFELVLVLKDSQVAGPVLVLRAHDGN